MTAVEDDLTDKEKAAVVRLRLRTHSMAKALERAYTREAKMLKENERLRNELNFWRAKAQVAQKELAASHPRLQSKSAQQSNAIRELHKKVAALQERNDTLVKALGKAVNP